jgi:hypothetical protein
MMTGTDEGAMIGRLTDQVAHLLVLAGSRQSEITRLTEENSALKARIQELELLVTEDPLTGVLNRRGLNDAWGRVESFLSRNKEALCTLLFFDVDHFKRINDELGHEMGDIALTFLARALVTSVRPGDIVARLGGDEFTVILGWELNKTGFRSPIPDRGTLLNVAPERPNVEVWKYPAGNTHQYLVRHQRVLQWRIREMVERR